MRFNKKNIGVLLVVAVILVLGAWFVSRLGGDDINGDSKYSAVYMATGDMYYGELSWFPTPHIKNAWYLERGGNNQLGVLPLKNAFWGPSEDLYLNKKEIVFWSKIKNGTSLAKALANPESVVNQGNNQQQPAPTGNTVPEGSSAAPSANQ